MLALQIYDAPGGALLLDASPQASGVTIATNEHGFESLRANIRLSFAEAFRLYDRPGLPHVALSDAAAGVAWEGRLEDVAITDGGVAITALGYWRALADAPYTALWSDSSVAEWRPVLPSEDATREPARWQMDNNNRLYLAPRKGETFGTPNYYAGEYTYETPAGGERTITTVTFTYALFAPVGWTGFLRSQTRAWATPAVEWSLAGNGALQSGTVTQNLATPRDRICFGLYFGNAAAAYAGETGATYLRITGLRVKTTTAATVTADAIAGALATYVNGINSTQISASGALIASPALDLTDELYEDEAPADILTRLAALGDNATPPKQWEVGVWENRLLHLRVRGSAGRAWYVDAAGLELERSLETLRNAVYAVYRDAAGVTQRTAAATDAASAARYGLTRRAALRADTTSATQAGVQRDAYLQDRKDPPARAGITIWAIYDAAGARWPLYAVRSGDTITLRNLPPTLSGDVDRIRTFRISRTEYKCDDDTLSVEPEEPAPSLETMLARRAEGIT